jgi:hypothetical protein
VAKGTGFGVAAITVAVIRNSISLLGWREFVYRRKHPASENHCALQIRGCA